MRERPASAGSGGGEAGGLTVAVVVRDRFSAFAHCLDAVLQHTPGPYRLLVVAGGVDPCTRARLDQLDAEHDDVTLYLADRPLTQAESRRRCLELAGDRFCVLLENDTIVGPDWLEPLQRALVEEGAAVVVPLVLWYRGVHAAGCDFTRSEEGGRTILRHTIVYDDLRRRRIGYPETHCMLVDLERLRSVDLFAEVEPFDVDIGLTLEAHGLSVVLEPRSVVTYAAPPRWAAIDAWPASERWSARGWALRHEAFVRKWKVGYDASAKRASYRRQELMLTLLRHRPSRTAVALTNAAFTVRNHIARASTARRSSRHFG